jgi:hypothetical protein
MVKDTFDVTMYEYRWRCIKSDDTDIYKVGEVVPTIDIIDVVNELNKEYKDVAKFSISHSERNNEFVKLNIESYLIENGNDEISFEFEFVPTKSLITSCVYAMQSLVK